MSITIIIPVRNEEHRIGACLDHLLGQARNNGGETQEILVVDGGSTDQTINTVIARGITPLASLPGRGTQQHTGALAATGKIFLFLHCDTVLPKNFPEHIYSILRNKDVSAGAFQLKINGRGLGFRLIEAGVQLRSTILSLPYGDQALFMYRETYFTAGGFPLQPIMEDVALICQLKKRGKIALTSTSVTTSARRWQQHGLLKTTLINQLMLIGRAVGIAPQQLTRFYYAQRK